MNAEEIHLYGLIGLRALAEYDPPEYRRAVDLSKQQLERKIELSLRFIENQELEELYAKLRAIIDSTENQLEMTYLLQNIYASTSLTAHFHALQQRHDQLADLEELASEFSESYELEPALVMSSAEELTKLSVMALLRRLREYVPVFNLRIREIEVDCVLKPKLESLPVIVIETKSRFRHAEQIDMTLKRLKTVMSAYGRKHFGPSDSGW